MIRATTLFMAAEDCKPEAALKMPVQHRKPAGDVSPHGTAQAQVCHADARNGALLFGEDAA